MVFFVFFSVCEFFGVFFFFFLSFFIVCFFLWLLFFSRRGVLFLFTFLLYFDVFCCCCFLQSVYLQLLMNTRMREETHSCDNVNQHENKVQTKIKIIDDKIDYLKIENKHQRKKNETNIHIVPNTKQIFYLP